eukprot:UN31683
MIINRLIQRTSSKIIISTIAPMGCDLHTKINKKIMSSNNIIRELVKKNGSGGGRLILYDFGEKMCNVI